MVKSYLTDFRSERFEFQQVIQIQAGIGKKAGVGPGRDSRMTEADWRPHRLHEDSSHTNCLRFELVPRHA